MGTDVTTEVRERAEAAVEDWFNHLADDDEPTVEQIGQGVAAAVLAALAGDPGDLPVRMAAAILHARLGDEMPSASQLIDAARDAAAAMSVRWEDHAATVTRLAKAEGRADKAEYDLEIRTHTARSNAKAHRIAYLESEKQRERAEAAEAERDALKAATQGALEVYAAHHKTAHPARLHDPDCAGCLIGMTLSKLRPATSDSREELRALIDASSARLAIERALACHARDDSNPRGPWCNTCLTVWPCATAHALASESREGAPLDRFTAGLRMISRAVADAKSATRQDFVLAGPETTGETTPDAPTPCPRCEGSMVEPGTEADGDWDSAAMRHHPYTGEPCTACNGTGKETATAAREETRRG